MKKLTKKLKGKKVLSLVLAAIMLATTFNIALPMLKLDASALQYDSEGNIIIDGVSQKRVVEPTNDAYKATYAAYASDYLNGCGSPTDIVIPGLDPNQDYVVQGMTYYPKKDWMLVTAYHNDETASSKVFALDAATGEFVAMFSFVDPDGSTNKDHGGGIAVSENNIYYACGDTDRMIAYAPLSAIDNAPLGQHTVIKLEGKHEFFEVGSVVNTDSDGKTTSAYTAYCCYDEGVLWTGNFFDNGTFKGEYGVQANANWDNMLWGYKLSGDSSEEEWENLTREFNKIYIATATNTITGTGATMTYNAAYNNGAIDITGSTTYDTELAATVDELTANFGYYYLEEGKTYTIEYTATNDSSYANEIFLFAPNGTHTNIHAASACKRTDLGGGKYKYQLTFTAGLKSAGADSTWPTTQSTDGSYTGKYTIRFDQNNITAARDFAITGLSITRGDGSVALADKMASVTSDHQGNPTYAIALGDDATSGLDIKQVQYATVHNGKIYLSRSYGSGAGNSIGIARYDAYSHLTVADIDLSTPGTGTISFLSDANTTKTINTAYIINEYEDFHMMAMSEGLCVIDDYVFVTFEGASNKYKNEGDNKILGVDVGLSNCEVPVDVVWKVDQYELLGIKRDDNRETACYERVDDISSINNTDEYIIVYESDEKNPVTQEHILYALDSEGGHNGHRLPKEGLNNPDHTVGIVGHKISEHDIDGNKLYLTYPDDDDVGSIRWKFVGSNGSYSLKNSSRYFTKYHTLQVSGVEASMAKSTSTGITLTDMGETWRIQSGGEYLWCNDGTHSLENTINSYYTDYCNRKGVASYTEQPGTFHSNATSTTNVLGRALKTEEDSYREFEIYKRVIDDYASTEESRVHTSMDADLQEDGTYTINLETYATAETQYQTLPAERPTDFIFVLDTSSSMAGSKGSDCSGYQKYTADLDAYAVAGQNAGVAHKDGGTYTGNMYVRIGEEFVQLYVEAGKRTGSVFNYKQRFWLYGYYNDTQYYWKVKNPEAAEEGGEWVTKRPDESEAVLADGNDTDARSGAWLYYGEHYEYKEASGCSRLCCMQTAMHNIITKIRDDANSTGNDHRIALVQYGSDSADDIPWLNTGMYSKTSNTMVKYTGEGSISSDVYANAFYDVADFETVRELMWSMNVAGGDSDTYVNYGFDMANGIINNSGNDYLATGDRNVAIIMITDGVPGKGSDYPDVANTVTDLAINETYEAKSNGASVYSVQMGNNSIDGFSMNLYMDAVSSEYVTAKSRINLGDRNPDGVDYHIDIPTGTSEMFNTITNNIFNSVQAGSMAGLVHLDKASIIREELEGAFLMDDAKFSASLVPGSYDKIGRMSFGDPVAKTLNEKEKYAECEDGEIAYNQDILNPNKLEIWGYDYTDQYISALHPGNKLRITISGVLANPAADLTNTSINNNSTTAIYKDSKWLENGRSFKYFPTEYFTIPRYTYVLDYGLQMLDTEINGTLKSVSVDLSSQRDANGNLDYKTISENGLVEIDTASGNQNLLYHNTPTNNSDSGYVLIQRDSGKYDWFEIKVVPASNVLYEETALNIANDSGDYHWSKVGDPIKTTQDLSTEKDVYGYDNNYASSTGFSNGTHYYSKVDSGTKFSDTASITFKGTGFDLLSACGPNTGVQLVTLKKDDTFLKGFVIDTYYKDTSVLAEDELLHQVPIVKWEGEYGTYTVETKSYYLSGAGAIKNRSSSAIINNLIDTGLVMNSAEFDGNAEIAKIIKSEGWDKDNVELIWFDDNSVLNGGTGVAPAKTGARSGNGTSITLDNYIDGFRVYNPVQDTSNYIESEQRPVYYNVIEALVDADTITSTGIGDGIAYITGSLTSEDENGNVITETLSFSNYQNFGPTDELYLKGGASSGITFNTPVADGGRVMVSLRAVNGTATATINGQKFTVNSATEMYYDITDLLTITNDKANVTIINSGSGILSVNNIKLTNTASGASLMMLSMDDLEIAQYYATMEPVQAKVENGVVTPVVDEEEEIPEDNTNTGTDTDTETEEKEEFSLFSLIELLIEFIEKILRNAFGAGNVF